MKMASTAAEARRFAENNAPIIHQVRASGVVSLRGIALVLNARGVRTARGGLWAATQVSAVLRRIGSEHPNQTRDAARLECGTMEVRHTGRPGAAKA